jgi:hypothetical protein
LPGAEQMIMDDDISYLQYMGLDDIIKEIEEKGFEEGSLMWLVEIAYKSALEMMKYIPMPLFFLSLLVP